MQEIENFNQRLKAQRKTATITVGTLLISGLALTLPLWTNTTKYPETLFCYSENQRCSSDQIKRGISWIVQRERRNQIFNNNIQIVSELSPESPTAPLYGLVGSIALLCGYGVSKSLTDAQEKAIHSEFSLLKIKALENDLIAQNHLELTQFSKQQQSEITKQAIARQATETIEAMKSESELQLDHLNGKLQGELALKQHELQIASMDKNIAENEVTTAELRKKLDKIIKTHVGTEQSDKLKPDEVLKNSLIDSLRSHEDGWLLTVIKAAKPLWIIGEQGTGKTNTAVAIGLIRKYCFNIPVFRIADRHLNGANSKVWNLLEAQLKADNDSAIIEVLQDTYERRLERIGQDLSDKDCEQFLLDEFTHLKDIDEESVKRFIKSTFSDTRKAKERFIGVTHLGTNEAFGDGTAAMRKAGSILIEKFTADGEKPLPRVVIKHGLVDAQGNKLEDVEHTLPAWFEAFKIHQHFNGSPLTFDD